MKGGDAILVILAAANRDPSVNPRPSRFDVGRAEPQTFTFGLGPHACPGAALATTIAVAGVDALITAGVDVDALAEGVTYRGSVTCASRSSERAVDLPPPPPTPAIRVALTRGFL